MFLQLIFSLFVVQVVGWQNDNSTNFVRRSERRIQETAIKEELTLRSKFECCARCAEDDRCDKCAWNSITKSCQIAKDYVSYRDRYNSRLEFAPEWTSYEKIVYSVSSYTGLSGRYTMSFEEAVDMCISYGTKIASPVMLLKARAEGFGSCNCGWLSDGSMGFVMQFEDPDCWGYYTTEIHECLYNMGDVYCAVP